MFKASNGEISTFGILRLQLVESSVIGRFDVII